MPSDPTGTHPSGVLTRNAPDFFDDSLAVGMVFLPITPMPTNTWFRVALLNDRNDGRMFKLYAIYSFSFGGGGLGCFFSKGPIGTFQAECQSIRPDQGTLNGALYGDIQTGSALTTNPYITAPLVGGIGNSGFDSMTNVAPFPFFILPAGYTLVCCNLQSSGGAGGAGFWFQVANE